jgi:hypothetical protein
MLPEHDAKSHITVRVSFILSFGKLMQYTSIIGRAFALSVLLGFSGCCGTKVPARVVKVMQHRPPSGSTS